MLALLLTGANATADDVPSGYLGNDSTYLGAPASADLETMFEIANPNYQPPLGDASDVYANQLEDGSSSQAAIIAGTAGLCWYSYGHYGLGYDGYHREIWQRTHWCAKNGVLTFRRSVSFYRAGTFCAREDGPWGSKISGGVGTPRVVVHSEVRFACDTNFFFKLRDNIYINIEYDAFGHATIKGSGRS
jgi:hypothetical protein